MGKGSGGTRVTRNNDFVSKYGFKNVASKVSSERTLSGWSLAKGKVKASPNNVQEYLDTGKFDAYGTNSRAKEAISKEIAKDMKGRGYDVDYYPDLKRIASTDGVNQIIISKSNGKWVAKSGNRTAPRNRIISHK